MTKKQKSPEQPADSKREFTLPFSPKNRAFYHKCAAYKKRGRILVYEGESYTIEHAEYDRAENIFTVVLVLVANG